MTRTRPFTLTTTLAALVVSTAGGADDATTATQKALDRAVVGYREAASQLDKGLLDAINKEIDATRKSTLKVELRQQVIQELTAEREEFEKDGTIPFSPRLRKASSDYLKGWRAAARPAEAAYDKAIDQLIKTKADAAAAALTVEKKKALAGRVVGEWECGGITFELKFRWQLHADGTAVRTDQKFTGRNTWTFEKDKLVIVNRDDPAAPPGEFHDICTVSADGRQLSARCGNSTYKGRLVGISK